MTPETELRDEIEKLRRQHVLLGRAARIVLTIALLVLGVFCFVASCTVPKFADILRDLYETLPLPALTQLVIGCASLCFWSSILLPIAGISYLWWSQSLPRAIVVSTIMATVLLLMCVTIYVAMYLPLVGILTTIGQGPK
ncbi:MAG: hypothetical protein HZA91_12725 [Verrucomicrobia bacterium]|nr:hypothetical protein [Verrucomicrobiota bacterium]